MMYFICAYYISRLLSYFQLNYNLYIWKTRCVNKANKYIILSINIINKCTILLFIFTSRIINHNVILISWFLFNLSLFLFLFLSRVQEYKNNERTELIARDLPRNTFIGKAVKQREKRWEACNKNKNDGHKTA